VAADRIVVVAVVAFAHPEVGTWRRGQTGTVTVDETVIGLVNCGYLEPVVDARPPALPAPPAVGEAGVTVYPKTGTRR
jgi:hypothetical protein